MAFGKGFHYGFFLVLTMDRLTGDWAFIAHRDWAGDYPYRRADGHFAVLERALAAEGGLEPGVRNLAPVLAGRGL